MTNLTPEMIEKAKVAKTAEELLELAKANGMEITADEAKTYFAQLNPKSGELDDDELDAVAGGNAGCWTLEVEKIVEQVLPTMVCPNCGTTGDWEWFGESCRSRSYYCRQCKLYMYLHNDENYSVMHTNGKIVNI